MRRGRHGVRAAALGLGLSLLVGCAETEPRGTTGAAIAPLPPASGIVVVTLDQWWAPGRPESPFAGFALQGTVHLRDALTVSPQLRPASASALTGQLPLEVGVASDISTALPPDAPYLPARLTEAGFATAGFVNNPILGWGSGFERGFELFDGPDGHLLVPMRYFPTLTDPEERVTNFLDWVETLPPDKPFFAWIHLTGTNWRNPVSREEEAAQPSKSKRGEPGEEGHGAEQEAEAERRRPRGDTVTTQLEKLDRALASLYEAAAGKERLREAAWILTGVNGRLSLEDPALSGYFIRPEVVQVPAAARPAPKVSLALAADIPFWTPDVARFVAVQARLEAGDAEAVGAGRTRYVWDWRAAEEFGWPLAVALERQGMLVVRGSEGWRVYQRGGEGWNLSNGQAPGDLRAALDEVWEAARGPRGPRPPIPEELKQLVAQAYEIQLPDEPQAAEPPSAEAQLEVIRRIVRARRFAVRAMPRSAFGVYRRVSQLDPSNRAAYVEAGQILSLAGMIRRAKPVLKHALERDPWDAQAWHWLGHIGFLEDQVATAEKILEFANRLQPNDPDILYDLACARSLQGDVEGTERYLTEAWAAGFRDLVHIQNDPDLRYYRESGSFQRFMRERVQ